MASISAKLSTSSKIQASYELIPEAIKKFDLFGANVPSFTISQSRNNASQDSVERTFIGGLLSFGILYLTFLFATHKLAHLLQYNNPQIIINIEENALDLEEVFPTNEGDFMMAFGLEDFIEGSRSDPRYIQWVARYIIQDEAGGYRYDLIPMHECSDAELAKLHSPDESTAVKMNALRAKNGLYCLDYHSGDYFLKGSWKTHSEYTAIDVSPAPCHWRYTAINGTEVVPREDCIGDYEKIHNYLGTSLNMVAVYNQGKFQPEEFGSERVQYGSIFKMVAIKASHPSYTTSQIDKQLLIDQTAFFQIGQSDEVEFTKMIFDEPALSTEREWPAESNGFRNYYKFSSFWIELGQRQTTIERSTYSILEWLGDVGGLFDGLRLLCQYFVAPIASMALRKKIYKLAVLENSNSMKILRQKTKRSKVRPYYSDKFNTYFDDENGPSCCLRAARKIKELLRDRRRRREFQANVAQELDLVKFLRQQKRLILMTMVTLNAKQRAMVEDLTQLALGQTEQLNIEEESYEMAVRRKEKKRIIKSKIVRSKTTIDRNINALHLISEEQAANEHSVLPLEDRQALKSQQSSLQGIAPLVDLEEEFTPENLEFVRQRRMRVPSLDTDIAFNEPEPPRLRNFGSMGVTFEDNCFSDTVEGKSLKDLERIDRPQLHVVKKRKMMQIPDEQNQQEEEEEQPAFQDTYNNTDIDDLINVIDLELNSREAEQS